MIRFIERCDLPHNFIDNVTHIGVFLPRWVLIIIRVSRAEFKVCKLRLELREFHAMYTNLSGWPTMRRFTLRAVLALVGICGAISRAAETQPLTAEQIARGQAIQRLLASGIDFARERGDWPKDLAELNVE